MTDCYPLTQFPVGISLSLLERQLQIGEDQLRQQQQQQLPSTQYNRRIRQVEGDLLMRGHSLCRFWRDAAIKRQL